MKRQIDRAVVLHGTDGKPTDHWLPWIVEQFKLSGYEVYAPLLPDNHRPNKTIYEQFLCASGWDFTDNVLVGHSSGATTILNLLSAKWFPNVRAVILAGTFLNEKLTKAVSWYVPGQFDNLFLEHYDPELIRTKAEKFYFVHGADDPYCDIRDAEQLCAQLNGEFIIIPGGKHLSGSSGLTELPQLKKILQKDGII